VNESAELREDEFDADSQEWGVGSHLAAAPDIVEVRRNGGVAATVGAGASAVAIAYLSRAAETGAVLDWLFVAVLSLIGAFHLHAFVDARTPLLVADGQGVRIRLGRVWRGIRWGALAAVEHTPRPGLLRDGRLVLVPHNEEKVLAELDAAGRRQSRISERLYGAPFALPLGLSTRVTGVEEDLTASLRQLAGGSASVIELVPGTTEPVEDVEIVEQDPEATPRRLPDPRPFVARLIGRFGAGRGEPEVEEDEPVEEIIASDPPAPLRRPRLGIRVEARAQGTAVEEAQEPRGKELRRPGSVSLVEEAEGWGDRVRPIARAGDPVAPLVIDEFSQPAPDPVIGPQLMAARTRIGLSVDQLAERTRIRPHVIESIEVDDFAPCGGDFYARGHLRTLARVLGVESGPLLTAYEERYADAPINARRVFEAELASGATGGIRATRGGPNWSALIAALMTVVLAWSIARLVMDTPVEIQNPAPSLADGSGPAPNYTGEQFGKVRVATVGTGSHIKITNSEDELVFSGFVPVGEAKAVETSFPVRVSAQFPRAVKVWVDGKPRGVLTTNPDPEAEIDRSYGLRR
jgi:hypothetical protein